MIVLSGLDCLFVAARMCVAPNAVERSLRLCMILSNGGLLAWAISRLGGC